MFPTMKPRPAKQYPFGGNPDAWELAENSESYFRRKGLEGLAKMVRAFEQAQESGKWK